VTRLRERAVVDAAPPLGRGDGETDGQVRFPHAGRAEQDDVFPPIDEAEIVEAVELLALERGLKREVKVGERLHGWEARGPHSGLEAAVIAQRDMGAEQRLDRVSGLEMPTVDLGEDRVERLKSARHLQIGELRADPVAKHRGRFHARPPASSA
jgi:hypothetical protein